MTKPNKRYALLPGLLEKVEQNELLSHKDRLDLLNGIGYVRAINLMAGVLGMDDYLRVVPEGRISTAGWHRVYQYLTELPDVTTPTAVYT